MAFFDDTDAEDADEKTAEGDPPSDSGDAEAPTEPPPPATPQTREPVGRQPLPEDGAAEQTPVEPFKPRELDDEFRAEIRDQILRTRTNERMAELASEVQDYMLQSLLEGLYETMSGEGEDQKPTYEPTGQKLREFAEQRSLVYDETPLLSALELRDSEDHRIGRAATRIARDATGRVTNPSRAVPEIAFGAGATELFRPETVLEIDSGSLFVFWKIDDKESYEPLSLDEPGIRDQVVRTWRELRAREKAHKRAEELAKQAEGVDKPLSEIFAETTITGNEGDQVVAVVHPPRFSWLSPPDVPPTSGFRPPPTRTQLRSLPGQIGDEFMKTVVDDLRTGEVGVTHSYDQAYYYVVRVEDRSYGFSPDFESFRERFASEPVFAPYGYLFSDYSALANAELSKYDSGWAQDLFERHNADFSRLDEQEGKPQG